MVASSPEDWLQALERLTDEDQYRLLHSGLRERTLPCGCRTMRKPVSSIKSWRGRIDDFPAARSDCGQTAAGVPTAWLPGWVAYLAGSWGKRLENMTAKPSVCLNTLGADSGVCARWSGGCVFGGTGLAPEARQVKSLQTALDGKQGDSLPKRWNCC